MSYLLLALLLGLIVPIAACFAVTYRAIDHRSGHDDARPADVIVVLGSAVWPDERPSPSLAARTRKAILLYHQGYVSHLILSGGLGRFPPEEAEVMRRLADEAGVPAEALVLDREAHSTLESLVNAKQIMDEREWEMALIVSDPFHLKRSLLMAGDIGLTAYGCPALDSPTYTVFVKRVYYTSREVVALWWYLVRRAAGPW